MEIYQEYVQHAFEHWEDLDITVVVDSGFSVGLEMERVDHVDIHQGQLWQLRRPS